MAPALIEPTRASGVRAPPWVTTQMLTQMLLATVSLCVLCETAVGLQVKLHLASKVTPVPHYTAPLSL